MIGKLSGLLDYRGSDHVLVDVRGVGYIVYCSERTLAALPQPGSPVALFTELVVREDLLQLYGFQTLAEREWHRLLTTVQGVGAKAALGILAALGTEGVARAVALGDVAAIRRAPGIGPKIAERVALELKNRVPAVMAMGATGARPAMGAAGDGPAIGPAAAEAAPAMATAAAGASAATAGPDAQAAADALSALVNLGYGQGEAAGAVAEVAGAMPEADAPGLIRAALRRLAPKG